MAWIVKASSQNANLDTKLEQERDDIIQEAPVAPEVTVPDFLSRLPAVSNKVLSFVWARLRSKGAYWAKKQKWAAFPEDPTKCHDENEVFKAVGSIVGSVEEAILTYKSSCTQCRPGKICTICASLEQVLWYRSNPYASPHAVNRSCTSKPDGYLTTRKPKAKARSNNRGTRAKRRAKGKAKQPAKEEEEPPITWPEVVVPAEFKLHEYAHNVRDVSFGYICRPTLRHDGLSVVPT